MTSQRETNSSSYKISTPPEDAKTRVSQFMKNLQDEICHSLEKADRRGQFQVSCLLDPFALLVGFARQQ